MAFHSYTLTDVLISSILAFIMLGVGLSLTPGNFKNIFIFPKSLIIGLSSQIIILPIIAFLISFYSDLSPAFKTGLIIIAACPGGTTSGLLTYYFRGNVALSISFTALNSIITLFTIPFVVNLSLLFYFGQGTRIHLSYIGTIVQIFSVTIIPALIGILIRIKKPEFANNIRRPVGYLMTAALGLLFIILFFGGKEKGGIGITLSETLKILPKALLLNLCCVAWGFLLGLISRIGLRDSYTIGIEASVHNTTLAFLIAETLLKNPEMVKPALVYAMFSFWTAALYSIVVKKSIGLKIFSEFKS